MIFSSKEPTRFFVIFDVDGVIVDSKTLVTASYRLAGAEMPPNAWGLSWKEWLPNVAGSMKEAERIHNDKNVIYAKMPLRFLNGATFLWQLIAQKVPVALLSGASEAAVNRVVEKLHLAKDDFVFIKCECTAADKKLAILDHKSNDQEIVYVDDDLVRGTNIAKETNVRFIYFTTQTPDELMEELWM